MIEAHAYDVERAVTRPDGPQECCCREWCANLALMHAHIAEMRKLDEALARRVSVAEYSVAYRARQDKARQRIARHARYVRSKALATSAV